MSLISLKLWMYYEDNIFNFLYTFGHSTYFCSNVTIVLTIYVENIYYYYRLITGKNKSYE